MKQHIWKVIFASGVTVLVAVFVWMNRFEYQHNGTTQALVRINRFTGQSCYLHSDGTWDSRLTIPPTDEKSDNSFAFLDSGNKCQ